MVDGLRSKSNSDKHEDMLSKMSETIKQLQKLFDGMKTERIHRKQEMNPASPYKQSTPCKPVILTIFFKLKIFAKVWSIVPSN